jgi:hypothetical protein
MIHVAENPMTTTRQPLPDPNLAARRLDFAESISSRNACQFEFRIFVVRLVLSPSSGF